MNMEDCRKNDPGWILIFSQHLDPDPGSDPNKYYVKSVKCPHLVIFYWFWHKTR